MNEQQANIDRNKQLSNHFLSHSFFIVLIYIVISTLFKMALLDWNMVYYIDTFIVVMIASGYFTVRGIQHGLFVHKGDKRTKKIEWLGHIVGAVLFGVLMVWFMEDQSNWTGTLMWFIFCSTFFGVGMYLLDRFIHKLSIFRGDSKDHE